MEIQRIRPTLEEVKAIKVLENSLPPEPTTVNRAAEIREAKAIDRDVSNLRF